MADDSEKVQPMDVTENSPQPSNDVQNEQFQGVESMELSQSTAASPAHSTSDQSMSTNEPPSVAASHQSMDIQPSSHESMDISPQCSARNSPRTDDNPSVEARSVEHMEESRSSTENVEDYYVNSPSLTKSPSSVGLPSPKSPDGGKSPAVSPLHDEESLMGSDNQSVDTPSAAVSSYVQSYVDSISHGTGETTQSPTSTNQDTECDDDALAASSSVSVLCSQDSLEAATSSDVQTASESGYRGSNVCILDKQNWSDEPSRSSSTQMSVGDNSTRSSSENARSSSDNVQVTGESSDMQDSSNSTTQLKFLIPKNPTPLIDLNKQMAAIQQQAEEEVSNQSGDVQSEASQPEASVIQRSEAQPEVAAGDQPGDATTPIPLLDKLKHVEEPLSDRFEDEVDGALKIAVFSFKEKFKVMEYVKDCNYATNLYNKLGFTAKTISVEIKFSYEGVKYLYIFCKYLPEALPADLASSIRPYFSHEIRFYHGIFPAIIDFQKSYCSDKELIFDNAVHYYDVNVKITINSVLMLEDLRGKNYHCFPMDKFHKEDTVDWVLETIAKFHSTFAAMRKRESNLFDDITGYFVVDDFQRGFTEGNYKEILKNIVEKLKTSMNMDKPRDSKILPLLNRLVEIMMEFITNIQMHDDYSVLCHGDLQSNNIIFQCCNMENQTDIEDVKLLDWQHQKVYSPVMDLSTYIYYCADNDVLEKLDFYLHRYYNYFCLHTVNLTVDPKSVYPKEVFLDEWKKYSRYGLLYTMFHLRLQWLEDSELPPISKDPVAAFPSMTFKHVDKYTERIMVLLEHFLKRSQITV